MIIQNALVFHLNEGFVKKDVWIKDGRFAEISDDFAQAHSELFEAEKQENHVVDAGGDYLIPGLVDIHFHGCAGYDFSDGTKEALETIGAYELEHGITSICPASMTLAKETLLGICENAYAYQAAQEAAAKKQGSRLCGIHLEGPFVSMEKKGAQNPAFIQTPDVESFRAWQDAAHGLVRLITIAPEVTGAEDFIRALADEVHISVGHTTSDFKTASRAFSLGADHVTHMYNAMPGFTHRAPGVIGAAFDAEHVMPELICDGIHIDPCVVRATFRLFGKERMVLISDSMMATGMEDGDYTLGGLPVTVKGNLATLSDGTIAGSATNLMDCMRTAVFMGIPLETAVRAATYNPAKAIGAEDVCGSIAVGMNGDCVLLSKEDLSTKLVVLGGQAVG